MAFDGWTFGFEIVNFLILAFLLQRFAYRPLLAAIDRRKAATAQEVDAARRAREEAEALRRQFEAEEKELAGRGEAVLADARKAAQAERETLLATARGEAAALVEEGRKRLAGERRAAEAELRSHAGGLAIALARRLLGEVKSVELRRAMVEQVFESLAALDPERREALLASLGDGPAILATAVPLPSDELATVRERLSTLFGRPLALEASVEPDLIEGLELRFPHFALRHSWQSGLEQAQRELADDDAESLRA